VVPLPVAMATVVYVVDDDPLVTESLGTALRLETPYHVEVFVSAAAALAAMPDRPPDVVLSDFKMPGLDGLAFLRAVRQAYPEAILILLTGYADKESAIRAINEVGIYQYVEKPWDLGDLLLKIRAGLERRELSAELRLAHERLIATERLAAVGRVASGIAHEIGNQLALVGYAEAIRERLAAADAELVEFADVIVAAQRRLAAMVDEIKDFARGAAGASPPLVLEPADVAGIVEEALAILRYDREVAGRRVTLRADARPLARVHRGKLVQVVVNLVRNAAQATPAGGAIAIAVGEDPGGAARLVVEDRGAGMPPEVLARLGEPFFTTRPDGSGLGIGICRRIVADHGGRIDFASTPGEGTRVVVTLPPLAAAAGGAA
jgi:signal transduction histidine kinase